MFSGKNILVGVTGGIAAYKTCDLVRDLVKASAQVRVVMTRAATRFVSALTFETLTGSPVVTEMFPDSGGHTVHIDLARWAHTVCICPATANTIGKIANGIADNSLTTMVMATTAPVILCPAMNKEMYANPVYHHNQVKLAGLGYHIVTPGHGELACGEVGWGRLADKPDILDALKRTLLGENKLADRKVLITAGPTFEPLDPVRYLGNRSSGKMGFALAEAAALQGAQVTLITGPTTLRPFSGITVHSVITAEEMATKVAALLAEQDILISAAAVADFRPEAISLNKIKKEQHSLLLPLTRTQDILASAAQNKGTRFHVGFSVETENEIVHSRMKLVNKHLDLIVINNPLEPGAGFEVDTNMVTILDKHGSVEPWPIMSKAEVAARLMIKISELISAKEKHGTESR